MLTIGLLHKTIALWFILNKLTINITKTCCVIFPFKNQLMKKIFVDDLETQKGTKL